MPTLRLLRFAFAFVLGLLGAAALPGCGDDHPGAPDGSAGSGGAGGSGGSGGAGGTDGPPPSVLVTVAPTQVAARQHLGGTADPLVYEMTLPGDLAGGGVPANLNSGADDVAVVQMELPQSRGGGTDENAMGSGGLVNFDPPLFCLVGGPSCANAGVDGYWHATVVGLDGQTREVQMAMAMKDLLSPMRVYEPVLGVFLAAGDRLRQGERLRLLYTGHMTARATDWTDAPFLPHFRIRSFAGGSAGDWTVLDDAQIQPLQVTAAADAKYVRAVAPLDVQVGVPFSIAVVVTDHYGNPRPIRGTVRLSGGLSAEVQLQDEWRKEVAGVTYAAPGPQKIVPQLDGARGIYHYTMAWAGPLPAQRLFGDVHSHTGDGGAQRKFVGTFGPGDHRGLFARTHDALRYMQEVAGLDFGAVSEHSVRWDAYTPPPGLSSDPAFAPGGVCAGAGRAIPALENWWSRHQQIVEEFDGAAQGAFVAFPAFEWHASHARTGDTSPLHRIVLFRDFSPDLANSPLPILPGDLPNLSPQCVVRFLAAVGFGPDKALVVPHMMQAADTNIDWDLTYANSSVVPRSEIEQYMRVGEIFSARSFDQGRAYGTPTLTAFEGQNQSPGPWSYRYGWTALGAHIGLIGSSDNHEQMPGVNDDFDLDGLNYHLNETGGYAVVLAATRDRAGIYDALRSRSSYATSGVRAWLDFAVDGAPMGATIARNAATVPGRIGLLGGLTISRVELWAAPVGVPGAPYQALVADAPAAETYQTTLALPNPVAPGGAPEEWLYYVRAFFKQPASPNDQDEAAWSSPIWITWSR